MLSPASHEQRRGSRPNSNFYIGTQSKKGTDYSNALYKTELCRSFSEMGCCRYGLKCRFAHGGEDLRPVTRHKKYKTEPCKNYSRDGVCPYGSRCRFVHEEDIVGDMISRSTISSPSPSSAENIFDFARFAGGFSDSKQIAKENQSSLSEQFSLDADPSGSLASPWNLSSVCHDMEEENEKDGQMQSIYRKAMLDGGKKDEFVVGNGWAQDKLSSQTPTQDSDLLLLGTSNSTRVFGNGKILPSHFHHYEDSSWQAFAQPQPQPQRRPSVSLSSVPNGQTEVRPTPPNSIASTTVSSVSPVSRSSVFQPAPRKSVIGFAAPASVDSSFTPSTGGRSKRSVLMEALEPEGSSPIGRADLPQLPAFFGGNTTPPSASPTKADASPTFEEEDRASGTTKKSVMVSSLSLSLSLVRTTSITTTVISSSSASSTSTPSTATPSSTSAPTADNSTAPTPPSSALPRDLPPIRLPVLAKKHRTSFDYADLDDDSFQIFSLPRRRTQSMSMSLSNTSSLFSDFQPVSKKSVPKAEPLSTPIAEPGSAPDSPTTGNDTEIPSLPGKRLPFFATLAISPKPETQTA